MGILEFPHRWDYDWRSAKINYGLYYPESDGIGLVPGDVGDDVEMMEWGPISLKPGRYALAIRYKSDASNSCFKVVADEAESEYVLHSETLFEGNRNEVKSEFWVTKEVNSVKVVCTYRTGGYLILNGISICETDTRYYKIGFWVMVLAFFMLVLVKYASSIVLMNGDERKQEILVALILVGTWILCCWPLFQDGFLLGTDSMYHIQRVEDLKNAFINGSIPNRISSEWLWGSGYASPIFYGETLLVPAALLRLIGFHITETYKIYCALIAFITIGISFVVFRRYVKDRLIGATCASLYAASTYYFFQLYDRGSLGEALAIQLRPLILWGIFLILDNNSDKERTRGILLSSLGMALMLQTHLLSCEKIGFCLVILFIVLIRSSLRKDVIITLIKTAIYTLLLSAWFIVPLADYLLHGDFNVHHIQSRLIQDQGLSVSHLIWNYYNMDSEVFFDTFGVYNSRITSLGPVILLFLVAYFFITLKKKKRDARTTAIVIISVLFMCMSLKVFPWDMLQKNALLSSFISVIQYPERFLAEPAFFLCLVAAEVLYVCKKRKKLYFVIIVLSVLINGVINWGYAISMPQNHWISYAYNREQSQTVSISGAEYLPTGSTPALIWCQDPKTQGDVSWSDYKRAPLKAEVDISSNAGGTISFDLLYYDGYRAELVELNDPTASNKIRLNCHAGENGAVTVDIPSDFRGRLFVQFREKNLWIMGNMVSLLSAIWLAFRWRKNSFA